MLLKKTYLAFIAGACAAGAIGVFLLYHYQTPQQNPITYLFAHGMGSGGHEIRSFAPLFTVSDEHNILTECDALEGCVGTRAVSFNFPDSNGDYVAEKVCLGQEKDIESLEHVYKKAIEHEKNGVILTGVSRGAATILNFVGVRQPDQVKALVVESPFDTIANIIKYQLSFWGLEKIPFSEKIVHKIIEMRFSNYSKDGICPLIAVKTIPKDMPILLIHSKADELISVNSSRALYLALLESEHTNVYYFEPPQGNHANLMYDENKEVYCNVVHAFYKEHALPYNPVCAQVGTTLLASCKPSPEEIKQRMIEDHWLS